MYNPLKAAQLKLVRGVAEEARRSSTLGFVDAGSPESALPAAYCWGAFSALDALTCNGQLGERGKSVDHASGQVRFGEQWEVHVTAGLRVPFARGLDFSSGMTAVQRPGGADCLPHSGIYSA